MDKKDWEDFGIRLAGAMVGGLEDAALEGYHKAAGYPTYFPYQRPRPNIPPYDDLIVGGLAIPPWVIGALLEKDGKTTTEREAGTTLKKFGEGDVFYAAAMLIHHTLVVNTPAMIPARRVSGSPSPGAPSKGVPAGRVIKL